MNQPMIASHETQGLAKIVEEANKSFLRESHSIDRSSFNILRVLSAFRLLYPQSPSNLYNAIIYITKNYDPQTYFQWKKAISQLSRSKNSLARIKSNYCRPDVSVYTKTYQNSFNRERLDESCEHLKSKSYAQIKIPQQVSYSKQPSIDHDQYQKDASQTNAQTGKRQFYTKADSISHVSKNHYISFQPYRNSTSDYRNHFDKENINSTNIEQSRRRESAYQYIQAMQRDLNRTSKPTQIKTPIDQSFIRNINNESPFLYTKTQQEISDPIEQQMNARSLTFYHYNLKLKGYSSLQANCFVFLKAKQEEMKAKIRHRSTLLGKAFLGLSVNMRHQKNYKIKLSKAENLYEISTMKKVFEVLKLIFILKREQESNKVRKQFTNPINLEFITSLLFTAGNQNGQDIIDFNKKVNQLLWSEQSGKLHSISKFFGKNSWMKLQNIQDLIKAYKKSLLNKVFCILRNQLNRNKRYDTVRQLNLKRFTLFALKIKHSRAACYKHKIQGMRAKMERCTLQKIMKSLIQIVYSNKLYSKKCEYIGRKHQNNLKLFSLQIWNEKAMQSLIKRNKLKKNIDSLYSAVSTLIGKLCFRKIIQKTKEIDSLIARTQENNMNLRRIFFFKNLKSNFNYLKESNEIQKLQKTVKLHLALKKWKQNTRKSKIINRIPKILRSYAIKTFLLPRFQELTEELREKITTEMKIMKKVFKLLQNITINNKSIEEQRINCLYSKLSFLQKQKSIDSLIKNFYRQRNKKIIDNNLKKTHLLQVCILKSRSRTLFENCLIDKVTRKDDQFAFSKLQQRIRYHKLTKIYRQLKEHNDIKRNMNKLRQNVYSQRARLIYQQMINLINERRLNKIFTLRKRNNSHYISKILVQSYQKQSQKKKKAQEHNNIILKYKCFEGLKEIIQKSKRVEKIAEKMFRRQTSINTKETIIFAIKETKVRKISDQKQIKVFFQNLKATLRFKGSQQKLYQINYHNMAKSFFSTLQFHEEILQQKKRFVNLSQILRKFIGMNRLKIYFTSILINRKHEYMALKFRALKLILCAFRGMQVKKVKKGGHKELAERLSTDLVG